MKKARYKIFGLLILSLLYSEDHGVYVSPGTQIGFNTDQGFFYWYQISIGLFFDSAEASIPVGFTPALSRGYKKYHTSKKIETYTDIQLTYSMVEIHPLGCLLVLGLGNQNQEMNPD